MRYQRDITGRVHRAATHFPAVVVTGARQTGKTTLLRAAFPRHTYVSFDLPSLAESAEQSPADFLARNRPPILFDEVQYVPSVFRHLKAAIDADRDASGRFVLTGSQNFVLMREVSESLAGRVAVFDLEGLSAREIGRDAIARNVLNDTPSALSRGSFPALWNDIDVPVDEFFHSYVATYLERDVRQIVNVGSLRDFERFLRLCAVRSAQLLNRSDLARDVGVTVKTIDTWLSALAASNQITLLEPYFENVGKRVVKSPKLFLNDAGLLMFLLGLDARSLVKSPHVGAVWETAVFGEIRKCLQRTSAAGRTYFYRDRDGREVDFVVAAGSHLDLVECKWTEVPAARDTTALIHVAEILSHGGTRAVRDRWVACRTPHVHALANGGRAVHGFALHEHLALE